MLGQLLEECRPEYIATYTRNPAIINMIRSRTTNTYPIDQNEELRHIACGMPHAIDDGNATYHFNRYDETGLFKGADPAKMSLEPSGMPLAQIFPRLQSVRHALVIAARIGEES